MIKPDTCQIFEPNLFLNSENIKLGKCVRIDSFVKLEGGAGIIIGDYTHIASFATILGGGHCSIGKFSGLAQGSRIITGGGHPFMNEFEKKVPYGHPYSKRSYSFVMIGEYCLIGANAVILPGVKIGDFSVISAGSVIRENIPDHSLAFGNPAKIIHGRYKHGYARWTNRQDFNSQS